MSEAGSLLGFRDFDPRAADCQQLHVSEEAYQNALKKMSKQKAKEALWAEEEFNNAKRSLDGMKKLRKNKRTRALKAKHIAELKTLYGTALELAEKAGKVYDDRVAWVELQKQAFKKLEESKVAGAAVADEDVDSTADDGDYEEEAGEEEEAEEESPKEDDPLVPETPEKKRKVGDAGMHGGPEDGKAEEDNGCVGKSGEDEDGGDEEQNEEDDDGGDEEEGEEEEEKEEDATVEVEEAPTPSPSREIQEKRELLEKEAEESAKRMREAKELAEKQEAEERVKKNAAESTKTGKRRFKSMKKKHVEKAKVEKVDAGVVAAVARPMVSTSTHKAEYMRLDRCYKAADKAELPNVDRLFQGSKSETCFHCLTYCLSLCRPLGSFCKCLW